MITISATVIATEKVQCTKAVSKVVESPKDAGTRKCFSEQIGKYLEIYQWRFLLMTV